jgi:hypothetical protein
MKKVLLSIIVLAAYIVSVSAVDNVANKTLSVQSKARIIVPITLANTSSQALDFGVIARGTVASTVVVPALASFSSNVSSGDAVVLSSATQTAAKFTVGGESGKTYAITIPSTIQTITSGGNSLNITTFSCSNGTGGVIGTNDVFYVGGTLSVPLNAVAASYTGTFSVTVAYN